ncbi:hypothetical protein V2J09_011029 [Rumex salicifolius]
MCSHAAVFVSSLTYTISLPLRRAKVCSIPRIAFFSHYSLKNLTVRFSSTMKGRSFDVSWLPPDNSASDHCGGWAIVESPILKQQTGLPEVLMLSIGTSAFVLLAALFCFSYGGKGSNLPNSNLSHILPNIFGPSAFKIYEDGVAEPDEVLDGSVVSKQCELDLSNTYPANEAAAKSEITKPRIVTGVDSDQEEAFSLLKKLKIIENDVKAAELCTRREYARWLVRASSLLERNAKHKIVPTFTLLGSMVTAFDDVSFGDPDFESIQALAEAGIVISKLSEVYCFVKQGRINFDPERFISRGDLIDWRGQLEYDVASAENMEMSKMKSDLLDTKDISLETLPGLFMDLLAGERSLHRKVFGKARRLQPNKPTTKAQAAVTLTSGRMTEAIHTELLRIEAEESSRQTAKKEIKRELVDRGEILRFWDERIEKEKIYGIEANQLLLEALGELEKEKSCHQKEYDDCLKKKAAIDCQRQLLRGLQLEVNEMTERLGSERDELIAEDERLVVISSDLQSKKEGLLDVKSWLQAEIEALRILRSWIEDEARKNQARANVLKEVGRRWRWNPQE